MKRINGHKHNVTASFAPYDPVLTAFMSMLAGRFMATANHELPEVEFEINSYNVQDDKVSLFGDAVYDGVNKPITLTIKHSLTSREDLNQQAYMQMFPRFVSAYYQELERAYGINFADEFPPVDAR